MDPWGICWIVYILLYNKQGEVRINKLLLSYNISTFEDLGKLSSKYSKSKQTLLLVTL